MLEWIIKIFNRILNVFTGYTDDQLRISRRVNGVLNKDNNKLRADLHESTNQTLINKPCNNNTPPLKETK